MSLFSDVRYSRTFTALGELMWKFSTTTAKAFDSQMPAPSWAPGPLLKTSERSRPTLYFPHETKSICPTCNKQAIAAVINGQTRLEEFRENPGVIDAQLVEEAGQILMRKVCDIHGPFEDVVSRDAEFTKCINSMYFGRDFTRSFVQTDSSQGPFTVRSGRGSFLIVDLTNRCNMKCDPCFMDANNHHYVHELGLQDIRRVFDHARTITPQREIAILFSGGEPTIAPVFLDAVRYAKQSGFHRLLVATNGIRLAEDATFAEQAKAAGLHGVYLQLDGVNNADNRHRGISNLFDVKRLALQNIRNAGMRTTLQVTVAKGMNDHRLGQIVQFAIENCDSIQGIVFQPIMFAGRDINVSDEERYAKRYTLSDLAHDISSQISTLATMRDWFPMSAYSSVANVMDQIHPDASKGSLYADVHPHHGVFCPILVNTVEKVFVPVAQFFNTKAFLADMRQIGETFVSPSLTRLQLFSSIMRHLDSTKAPADFTLGDLKKVLMQMESRLTRHSGAEPHDNRWRLMLITGMWFQDVFNMDLTAIQMSSTVVAADPDRVNVESSQGEISFCAYNGAGWRVMNEELHPTANLSQWHHAYGRHSIYAHGKLINIEGTQSRPISEPVLSSTS